MSRKAIACTLAIAASLSDVLTCDAFAPLHHGTRVSLSPKSLCCGKMCARNLVMLRAVESDENEDKRAQLEEYKYVLLSDKKDALSRKRETLEAEVLACLFLVAPLLAHSLNHVPLLALSLSHSFFLARSLSRTLSPLAHSH